LPPPKDTELRAGTIDGVSRSVMRLAAAAAAAGVAVGALSLGGQSLGGVWGRLGNSGAVWLCAAFLVGSLFDTITEAALGGLLTLVGAVFGYYVSAKWFVSAGVNPSAVAIWVATAIVGGPVFGAAGEAWRRGAGWPRIAAVALLGGALVGESVYLAAYVRSGLPVAAPMVVLGLTMPALLLRTGHDRARGWMLLVPCAIATFGAYRLIGWAFTR
jgi:uncharacterized protein DUF6518